eukprot:6829058-Lingulodinium_polyedra.AAC.1
MCPPTTNTSRTRLWTWRAAASPACLDFAVTTGMQPDCKTVVPGGLQRMGPARPCATLGPGTQ